MTGSAQKRAVTNISWNVPPICAKCSQILNLKPRAHSVRHEYEHTCASIPSSLAVTFRSFPLPDLAFTVPFNFLEPAMTCQIGLRGSLCYHHNTTLSRCMRIQSMLRAKIFHEMLTYAVTLTIMDTQQLLRR